MSDVPPQGTGMSTPPNASFGRGLLVILAAVIIGVLVLNSLDNKTTKKSASSNTTIKAKATTSTSSTSTTLPLRQPAQVKVIVANASDTTGVGTTATDSLTRSKYATLKATSATVKLGATAVYFEPGYEQEAKVIATVLNIATVTPQPMPAKQSDIPVTSLGGANVLVVIGNDLSSSFSATGTTSSGSGTGTTVRSTSTTRAAASTTIATN